MAQKFKIVDYTTKYGSIMQFNRNKNTYIHGWYPFVEGYSKQFILSIIDEYKNINSCLPSLCLEPFCGSGTTPLELQKLGIECKSFEVSPFMYNLAKVKLTNSYTVESFNKYYTKIKEYLNNPVENICALVNLNASKRIVEKDGLDKWNFDKDTMNGILDIKYSISKFNNSKYERLFTIALASILLEISNVYRNGKCISYKKKWKEQHITRKEVHEKFLVKLKEVFLPDIKLINTYKKNQKLLSNNNECYLGDVRKNLNKRVDDDSIDLVITSPPYLNSRDYTDTYMIELRLLDYLKNDDDVKNLRKNTIRSHVQVKWNKSNNIGIKTLNNSIENLKKHESDFWNKGLINMIEGYFEDMSILFDILYKKVKKDGLIFFNVANSAYHNIEIKTDEIIAEIAEKSGFTVIEIREARRINPSSQQKENIPFLRESVIVIKKVSTSTKLCI
ncbi:DNA methylase [Clostridium cavendishii DSM 21758]|uniref:site-specific DNA-methyltransferase (cytosine-N(4)-specific) n=1 Tax=Clostridium cavendishii DSM 21758 TaxID=1121302 RepID=A0A1M6LUY5_9CLOT|nr:DNA methyltransferase [Clostridium cavendishii]SHJ74971.1 DNA methylase [Clostridium cavendishii DSM 21758]